MISAPVYFSALAELSTVAVTRGTSKACQGWRFVTGFSKVRVSNCDVCSEFTGGLLMCYDMFTVLEYPCGVCITYQSMGTTSSARQGHAIVGPVLTYG